MESCLTLVRSFYSGQDAMIQEFVKEHPTNDKNRLMSKILAQMMIMCNAAISEDQAKYLQTYKMNPVDLDYQQSEYAALIAIDWEALKYVYDNPDEPQPGEGSDPVQMSNEEAMMSNEVEDYSDDLRRETELE